MELVFLKKTIKTKVVSAKFTFLLPIGNAREARSRDKVYVVSIRYFDMVEKYRGRITGYTLSPDTGDEAAFVVDAYSNSATGIYTESSWVELNLPGVDEDEEDADEVTDSLDDPYHIFGIINAFKRLNLIKDEELDAEQWSSDRDDNDGEDDDDEED